jgi:hypothetical protein
MSNEIKLCFESYVKYMKSNHLKTLNTSCLEELSLMTSSQISSELDLIHIQYILSQTYSISETSAPVVAYKHLKRMIDTDDINKKCTQLEISLISCLQEIDLLKEQLDNIDTKIPEEIEITEQITEPVIEISNPIVHTEPPVKTGWFF